MNKRQCDTFTEWMSLAQDGLLNGTQMHLLHAHISVCPECSKRWTAMTNLSHLFHAAPMVAPSPGFTARLAARLAYRAERRRLGVIGILLGIGVIALIVLAMPSVLGALYFTGETVLPYGVLLRLAGLVAWAYVLLTTLADAAWLLLQHFSSLLVCAGGGGLLLLLALVWLSHRTQREASRA